MLEFTFTTHSQYGRTAVQIRCNNEIITVPEGQGKVTVTVPDCGMLDIDFFSKVESDTIVDNGIIVADTEFRFDSAWCDNIKLESWFVAACVYRPRYFAGFLEQVTDAPSEIKEPYQFNFPGNIIWSWEGNFWDWYFKERNSRTVINFLDKDPDRVWKFGGSLDPCEDLVEKIREVIK
jgi:hypothetical protein